MLAGDSRINNTEGVHVICMPQHYGALSPLHVVAAAVAGISHGCGAGDGFGCARPVTWQSL